MSFDNAKQMMNSFTAGMPHNVKTRVLSLLSGSIKDPKHEIHTLAIETNTAAKELDEVMAKWEQCTILVDSLEKAIIKKQGTLETLLGLMLKLDTDFIPEADEEGAEPIAVGGLDGSI